MTPLLAGKDASAGVARAGDYARHRPELTLLYQLVEQYYPAFVTHLAARERTLPAHLALRQCAGYSFSHFIPRRRVRDDGRPAYLSPDTAADPGRA